MNLLKHRRPSTWPLILTLIASLALVGLANAAPTARAVLGVTSVELSEEFVGALGDLGVGVSDIGRASLRRGVARFWIPGGAIDLASLRGEILHTGGLSLEAGGTKVELSEFIIDTTGDSPVLTGLAAVNGDVVARLPLFDLELTEAPSLKRFRLRIEEVLVTLSEDAATTLNDVFNVSAFTPGFPIGTARVKVYVR